ncbi:TIM barrel protein [Marinimicrobium alkaliphilum]|uniref:TIM barrel protein n=1 Tax=Marinimicrobium alkaliphilum TaxID=2202654 RepID=UPI000DBAC344|nr:TIM barrel protein [Marinimicrobium alkaliphilum]
MKRLNAELIEEHNQHELADLERDYAALGEKLSRNGIAIEKLTQAAAEFQIAVPSWGTGTGGTRFARFPGEGEPRNIFEKIEDCAVINELSGCTDSISPHFPWDWVSDFSELKQASDSYGLKWVSVNSNTFQDQPGQTATYKYGSLSNTQKASRELAIQHNLDCIEYGKQLGAKSLTVWVGDGSNHPGQQHFQRAFERYLASAEEIYKGLPDDWEMHLEHKMFEPAFYSTVIQDWGSNILAAMHLGPKCKSLVDLGHHAPNTNIEMIVSRLIQFKKLGGFHFNDSKYGDDDLDSGSLHPYQQFLIFNELVDADYRNQPEFNPAYMLDQSHNVTDPIESLVNSAIEVQRSYIKALIVDREALYSHQDANDAMMASCELKNAFNLDVSPILAMARYRKGAAIEPLISYRAANYRKTTSKARPRDPNASGSGIV